MKSVSRRTHESGLPGTRWAWMGPSGEAAKRGRSAYAVPESLVSGARDRRARCAVVACAGCRVCRGSPGAGVPTGAAAGAIPGAASGLGARASRPRRRPRGSAPIWRRSARSAMAKLCASQFGQMLGSLATGPMASVTGGFLPSLCPPPGTIPPGGAGFRSRQRGVHGLRHPGQRGQRQGPRRRHRIPGHRGLRRDGPRPRRR